MAKNEAQERKEQLLRNEEKWTPTLMEAGWTVLPSIILECQARLELDAVDVNILMHLARHWWYSDNPPRPSKRTIAECMRIDESTVRRHIAKLEKRGLIRRSPRYHHQDGGQRPNEYIFDGLITAATPLAEDALRARRDKKERDQARRTVRGATRLRVVKDSAGE
jgi:predicted transcriptional regulator